MYKKRTAWIRTGIIGLLVIMVFIFTIYQFYHQARQATDRIMADQVSHLAEIFKQIDDTCGIVSFAHNRNYIDFLTVKQFVGSEVGALALAYPERWQGPYLHANYTMQGKQYEIIKTKEGFYIVPGQGVQLSNNKIIGTDIVFTYETDIESFVNNTQGLEYDGKPLAKRLHLKREEKPNIVIESELAEG